MKEAARPFIAPPGHGSLGTAPAAVLSMLERFIQSLAAGNVTAAAELWDLPALILGDQHVHGPMSRPHLERLFAETLAGAQEGALRVGAPRVEKGEWLSERIVRIDARWPQHRFGGFLTDVETSAFIVRIDEETDPKIRALLLLPQGFPRPLELSRPL